MKWNEEFRVFLAIAIASALLSFMFGIVAGLYLSLLLP